MKKIVFTLIASAISLMSFAQAIPSNPYPKTITVSGTAEMEIVPDQIYFRVVLKEYQKDKNKVELEKLEKELYQAVSAAGIPKEDLTVETVYGDKWRRNKYKTAELYNSKTYIIKVSTPGKIDEVLDKVNPESINSVSIRNYSHSKMEEFKKQLKIQAMKAAKDKATYMLAAVDEKLGALVEVIENDYQPIMNVPQYRMANVQWDSNYETNEDTSDIGFQKIKIQFQVTAKFAIQ